MKLLKKLLLPVILLLLLIFAFLLRSKMLLNGDFYYLIDQSRDLLLAKTIVIDHKLTLIGPRTGMGGIFHGPLWIYLITPFFVIAHGDPFWTLIPLFSLVSLGIVALGFFIGWRLYGKWMGVLFAFLLSLSGMLAQTVPFSTNAQAAPLMFLLYLYSIIQFMRGKDVYIILALFFTGLGFQFESAFAVLWIPLTILAIILRKKLPSIKNTILGIGAFVLAVSTFILFDVRHQFLMTLSALKLITKPSTPLPGYEQYADITFRFHDRVISLWNSLFTPLFKDDQFSRGLIVLIIIVGVVFLLQNIFVIKKTKTEDREYLFVLLGLFLIYGIYVLYPLPLWEHYLLPISVLAVFILALSIQKIFLKALPYKISIILFLIFITIPAFTWINTNYHASSSYASVSDGSYKNQLEVAKWLINDTKNKDYGYFVYTTSSMTYSMDYLLWWLSQENKLGNPSNQKHPTTYVILYPHKADDEGAHDFWKKNVMRTKGKVIETKTFPSGITVEKLSIPANEEPADPNYYQNLIFR